VAAARLFFGSGGEAGDGRGTLTSRVTQWTVRHLQLVGVSLLLALLVGIPLGILASRPGVTSRIILATTGIIYTIPSLALLALLVPIPFFGISTRTVVVALLLYSLLPIVRNTASGLQDIPRSIRESAAVLGLTPWAQLTRVYLPMASRTILSGVKTSAVINVATATLAALIGAGGLGEPIFIGLSLNDHTMILEGAVPVAVLALAVETAFGCLDRWLIPRGLRL
jgi:osmoprotectant transport system permease protein